MSESRHILISVNHRHVASMFNGTKTLELRRRTVRIPSNTRVWIYSKVPRGHVEAVGIVENVIEAAPSLIWRDYGKCTGISKSEFEEYFSELNVGCAILFKEIRRLHPMLSLQDIRARVSSFQPPQFFKKIAAGSPELAYFESAFSFPV